MFTRFGR